MSFIKSGSFIHYLFKYFPIPGSSSSKTAFMYMLIYMSHSSLECCLHFSVIFLLELNDAFFSLFLPSKVCWVPLEKSHFSCIFHQDLPFGYLLILFDWHSGFWSLSSVLYIAAVPSLSVLRSCFAMFWANSYIWSRYPEPAPTGFSFPPHRPQFASLSVCDFWLSAVLFR